MKKNLMTGKKTLALIIIVLIAGWIYVQLSHGPLSFRTASTKKTYQVILTSDGFIPREMTLPRGAYVLFKTTRDQSYWPASDNHPTHTIYPEFDPKQPIARDKTWSFQFAKAGVWRYHDHLSPNYTGTISVTDQQQTRNIFSGIISWVQSHISQIKKTTGKMNITAIDAIHKCNAVNSSESTYQQCWKDIFRSVVLGKGIDAGLRLLGEMRDIDLSFATECHVGAHAIGELAYEVILEGKAGRVSEDTTVCNFGYYHGLMQEFVSHGKNLDAAKRFCLSQTDQNNQDPYEDRRVAQCFHGIGHGLVFWYAVDGKPSESVLAKRGIEECKKMVSPGVQSYAQCFNGVFGGIAALYFTLHGFTYELPGKDPYWLCKEQDEYIAKYCYNQLTPPVFRLTGYDLVKTGTLIINIPDEVSRVMAMEHLGKMPTVRGMISDGDYMKIVEQCRTFGDTLGLHCVYGLVWSIASTGEKFQAITRASDFCVGGLLTQDEKNICMTSIIEQIKFSYKDTELRDACTLFFNKTGTHCPYAAK